VNESTQAGDGDAGWKILPISPAVTVNLLSLQGGITQALGSLTLSGGTQVNQIRLGVDSVEVAGADGSAQAATLPSATGFKIVGSFPVPRSGVYDLYAIDPAGAVVGTRSGMTVNSGATTAGANF
jgi:hypothetical protein